MIGRGLDAAGAGGQAGPVRPQQKAAPAMPPAVSAAVTASVLPPGPPDAEEIERLADAAAEVVDCMRVLTKSGTNLVAEVLGGRDYIQLDHYPPGDIYDPETHSQVYFHAHPPGRGPYDDYGHFHTFLRPKGMPPGVAPAPLPGVVPPEGDNAALSHLVAISMDRFGRPVRLFTTNRWVTAETWYAADDVIAMLDRFEMDVARPSWPLNRWLSAMMVLYRRPVAALLRARDAAVAERAAQHPETDVFEDRGLEVTSALAIDLDATLAEVRRAMGMA